MYKESLSKASLTIHRRIPSWDSIAEIQLPARSFLPAQMKYQKIMARNLPEEVTQGTLEGDIVPGDITFYRLQSYMLTASFALIWHRVKYFRLQLSPSEASVYSQFRRWEDSTVMY